MIEVLLRYAANLRTTENSLRNECLRQPGDLEVLEGVAGGAWKEARTRGFPSPSFGGFGFVVDCCASFIRLVGRYVLIVNLITGGSVWLLSGIKRPFRAISWTRG